MQFGVNSSTQRLSCVRRRNLVKEEAQSGNAIFKALFLAADGKVSWEAFEIFFSMWNLKKPSFLAEDQHDFHSKFINFLESFGSHRSLHNFISPDFFFPFSLPAVITRFSLSPPPLPSLSWGSEISMTSRLLEIIKKSFKLNKKINPENIPLQFWDASIIIC